MKSVPASRYLVFVLLASAGAAFDVWTKDVVFRDLGYPAMAVAQTPGEFEYFERGTPLEGESRLYLTGNITFRLLTSFNRGALWGLGQNYTSLYAVMSVVACLAIVYWLFFYGGARSRWLTVALGFIFAGTVGNLYDRLALHGCIVNGEEIRAVRDFLLFTFWGKAWPVFNFADVFLVTGAIMLVVQSLRPEPEEKPDAATPA